MTVANVSIQTRDLHDGFGLWRTFGDCRVERNQMGFVAGGEKVAEELAGTADPGARRAGPDVTATIDTSSDQRLGHATGQRRT